LIARAATAQDDTVGDGTTSIVLLIGELFRQAERYVSEGLHPRVIADGFDIARVEAISFLDKFAVDFDGTDREVLCSVARTALGTKLSHDLVDKLTPVRFGEI
jgi:T-complex protein 1 subunit zeta